MPSEAQEQRRLSVIMFTDMVGYSSLTQRDESLALQLLEEHRGIVRPILARHGGREVKTIGDAFLVEFPSVLAAATCAVEIQRRLHDHNQHAPAAHRIQIRIGLHVGDVVYRENDVFGDGVNIAARIEPLAEAGGICISEDVARQIQNKSGHVLRRLGSGELKNIEMPVAIYRIILPWQKQRLHAADRLSFLLAKKSARRALVVCGVAGLLILAALLLRHSPAPALPGPVNRLAVLPLVNFSGEAKDEYFADGMTDELISSLSTIRELNVIARTSIARFKGTRLDITEIGSALNVGSIIEGTVLIAGEQARIKVNLVDVSSQKTIWSQEYAPMIKDIFAIQSAIAQSVTDALKVQFHSGEKSLLGRHGPDNSEAYRQYLLGRTQLNKRTGEEIMKAIGSFSAAIKQDAAFAPAYAGLAECYTLAGSAGYGSLPHDEAIANARTFSAKAVALDDSLAEAHTALGYVKFRIDWDWVAAETEFKRALQLKPGYAQAHERYALFLAIQRRFDEAMAEMQRARQLDPLSPSVSNGVGRILHFQRHFDEAVLQFNQTLKLDPRYAEAYFSLGMSYQCLHRYDDGIAAMKTALELSGNRPVIRAMLAVNLGLAGHRDEARKIYDDMRATSGGKPGTAYQLGIIAVALGELDQAFQHFTQAYEERDGILIYLGVDPVAEAIWPDPRFAALIKQMNL